MPFPRESPLHDPLAKIRFPIADAERRKKAFTEWWASSRASEALSKLNEREFAAALRSAYLAGGEDEQKHEDGSEQQNA
jgi:hypothetical protein